jgi:hypothetical protein
MHQTQLSAFVCIQNNAEGISNGPWQGPGRYLFSSHLLCVLQAQSSKLCWAWPAHPLRTEVTAETRMKNQSIHLNTPLAGRQRCHQRFVQALLQQHGAVDTNAVWKGLARLQRSLM